MINSRSQFEPYVGTIDDEDNFFDAEFMSAYIAYSLVTRLRELGSIELRQATNSSNNLVRDIAREIFAQSESEPCGLKGCRLNVLLETAAQVTESAMDIDDENTNDSMSSNSSSSSQRILLDR